MAKAKPELLSLADIANIYGISREPLSELHRKKKIRPIVYGSQGVAHLFDINEVADAARLPPRPLVAAAQRPSNDEPEEETYPVSTIETFQTAKARKMSADATSAEIKMAKERGTAIDPNIIKAFIDDMFTKVRTRLRAVPDKVAVSLRLTPAQAVVLADAVDEALNELSDGANVLEKARAGESDERNLETESADPEATEEDDS